MEASLAKNTRKAYSTGLSNFSSFRRKHGWPDFWPPSSHEILLYIAFLSLRNFSHKTVTLYLSAISFQCRFHSVLDPTKHFLVTKTLQGLKRTAKAKRVRLPITVELLQGTLTMLSAVCRDTYEATLFRSAFSLAFFGFFRVGEITSAGRNDGNLNKVLSIHDIRWALDGSPIVQLRFSKADQLGKGVSITLVKQINIAICPVQALQAYLAVRPSVQGPLFCHCDGR